MIIFANVIPVQLEGTDAYINTSSYRNKQAEKQTEQNVAMAEPSLTKIQCAFRAGLLKTNKGVGHMRERVNELLLRTQQRTTSIVRVFDSARAFDGFLDKKELA